MVSGRWRKIIGTATARMPDENFYYENFHVTFIMKHAETIFATTIT
jgi:hypothetical protein